MKLMMISVVMSCGLNFVCFVMLLDMIVGIVVVNVSRKKKCMSV